MHMNTTPAIRVTSGSAGAGGRMFPLRAEVTTVGRGGGADIRLDHPTVSVLHAELVRRGPYLYVADAGLSRNGTRVNGRPVARRLLRNLDVVRFGTVCCQVSGLPHEQIPADQALGRAPELTGREADVLAALCRPAQSDTAFVLPATVRQIAKELCVTEAAVKQHLLHLYKKFRIPEGTERRVRLANAAVAQGLSGLPGIAAGGAAAFPAEGAQAGPALALGERLRLLRRERGLTQELLATRTGLSACAVRDIEAGRREFLLPVTAARLATVLGVDATALANGTRP